MNRMLGKQPRRFDARSPRLAMLALNNPLPPAPASLPPQAATWSPLGNDQVGDCTIATCLHMVQAWSVANHAAVPVTTEAALAVYAAITGYDPANPATDRGAVEVDVLQYWLRTGIAVNDVAAADQIDGYAVLDHADIDLVRRSIAAFGGVFAGLAMPLSAQSQNAWDVTAEGDRGDGAPGSWGGHAVPLLGYDADGPICISWGQVVPMSWAFWQRYADEAYAPLSLDWVQGPVSPRGLPWRSLVADIHAMCGSMRFSG